MIKDFVPRLYQETITATAAKKNILAVLPTGMGKTALALLLAAHRLKVHPESKVLLLAPTKPLVDQHKEYFKKHLDVDESSLIVFTGFIKPEKRGELWKDARIIFSTPQCIENDVISEKIKMEDVSLVVFDECHRAVGDYAYGFLAKSYVKKARYPKILGLTASPGTDAEKIKEVCKNLYIEDVEIRTRNDPDVKPYVQNVETNWVEVDLPKEFQEINKYLNACFRSKLKEIKNNGYLHSVANLTKKDILQLQGKLQSMIAHGERDMEILRSVSLAAESLKIYHASELLETQGVYSLRTYLERIEKDAGTSKVKAVQNLAKDLNYRSALVLTRKAIEKGLEHPKVTRLREIVSGIAKNADDFKILIFNNFRDNAQKLVEEINKINGIRAELFVGQQKRNGSGLTQKEQKAVLDKFRDNTFNVLVATSIGEEGLDIPKVDIVLFYEPIPSAIRHIQRSGRTGRNEKGSVIILMTKNSRDQYYRWSAFSKEKKMYSVLSELKKKFSLETRKDHTLNKFISEKDIKIVADYREKGSGVIKELIDLGVKMNLEKLESADYVLSTRVGVEYKTVKDFVDSIIDGRLLQQLKNLSRSFEKPVILIEGTEDIFSQRNIHPNAIRGMLATITVSYGIPVIQTKNFKETAALLGIMAKREQEDGLKDVNMHISKPIQLSEQQEYVIGALPSVGPVAAKELLKKFGSVSKVINASEEHLKKVERIGEKIAKNIRNVADSGYDGNVYK